MSHTSHRLIRYPAKSTVVGYVRPAPEERPGAADGAIIGYATRHGLAMAHIHRDEPAEAGQTRRSGFLAALDDLREHRTASVLIASLDHLSPVPYVRDALIRLVEEAGGRVYLAVPNPHPCAGTEPPAGPVRAGTDGATHPRPGRVADPGVLPAQAVSSNRPVSDEGGER